ncbi:MAG: PQQ-binding-like beta-propeller repeat protein [Planctomycetales bacterium]
MSMEGCKAARFGIGILVAIVVFGLAPANAVEKSGAASSEKSTAWPVFRGNATGDGIALSQLPEELEVMWEFQAEDSSFAATAVIENGIVYVGDADNYFYAIDLETGAKLWSHQVEIGFIASPAIQAGRVFVGDSNGTFYCFDARSGDVIWKHQSDAEINSSANFYKDSVLVGSQDGSLYRFRTKDGSIVWKYTIEASGGIQCSPTLADKLAFVCGCDGKLHVIDVDEGSTVETIEIGDPTLSTPAVAGDNVYFGTEGANVYGVDWRTAKVVWTYQNQQRRVSYRSSAAVTKELVIIGGRNKSVEAVKRDSGELAWSFPTGGRIDSSPVVVGNRIFVGSADGRLYQLDLQTGDSTWSHDAGAGFEASPAVAENRLVIGNRAGVLFCFGQ